MVRGLRHINYPNVVSTLALIGVLAGGGAYAASKIGSKDIARSAVKTKHLKRSAVTTPKIRGGAVTADKLAEGVAPLFGTTIPSGATVTGVWGGRLLPADTVLPNNPLLTYGFPIPAPEPLVDAEVSFGADTPGSDTDADPACTGSVDGPSAPPGRVCIYVDSGNIANVAALHGFALDPGDERAANAYGFIVRIVTTDNTGSFQAQGTWAYTAP